MNDLVGARARLSPRWTWLALAYLAGIYASVPVVFPAWRWLAPRLRHREGAALLVLSAGVAIGLLVHAWRVSAGKRAAALSLLAATASAYGLLLATVFRHRAPLEKIHLVEYGALAFFALNAASQGRGGWRRRVVALVLVALAGAGDELLQAVVPNRYCDVADMLWNCLGGALGALVWLAASAHSPWRREDAA
jgi:hypothetical protein